MPSSYKVKDKRRLLIATLQQLSGSAFVSFEGDLSDSTLLNLAGASGKETGSLKRNTIQPKQDFVVLPLETETIGPIMAAVGGTVPRTILHIQIEKNERLEAGFYDNFDPNGIFFGPSIPPERIEALQHEGVLLHLAER